MSKFLLAVCVLGMSEIANAQSASILELEGGVGYVFGGGAENQGPSLPAFDASLVIWPSTHWGFAARWVEGPGEDLHTPIESFDRTFLGQGDLRYGTVTVRHRGKLISELGLEFGLGALFGGQFATIQMFRDPPRRTATADSFFSGFAVELMLHRAFGKRFGVKAGVTCDFNLETVNLQPVVLGVVRF